MTGAPLAVSKPLTLRLLKRILGFSVVLVVLLAGTRAWWEYHLTLDQVQEELAVIENTMTESVAANLWDYDQELLALHVEGIRRFRYISYAAVTDRGQVVAQSGVLRTTGVLDREFQLFMLYKGQRQHLGLLHVQADLQAVEDQAFDAALRMMAFNAALVFLVAGLVFWLTSTMISRHLAALAAHFQSFRLDASSPPLVLDKEPSGDELDVLASAVNAMQDGLSASYAQVLEAQAEVRSLARFPQENPSPVMRTGVGGQLLTTNPASAALLAHLGVEVGQGLPEPYAGFVSRSLAEGQVQHFEVEFGGRVFAFAARPIALDQTVNLYGLDITERKRAEEDVRRMLARQQCLVRVLQRNSTSIQEFLDYSLAEALALTESRFGYIYHYSEETQEFVLNTWSSGVMAECTVKGAPQVYQLEKTGIWGEVVRQKKSIIVNDFHAPNPLKRGYPEGHVALNNFMSVPVLREGTIKAVAGVANRDGDYRNEDAREFALFMDACWQVVGRMEAEGSVLRSLHEKEILLKEIHHRVKNNLQLISSLLFLQAEYVIEPLDKAMFEESQKRISAMALVHEELYGSSDLSSVGMGEFVPRLVNRVVAGADVRVLVEYQVDDVHMAVTQSIPCGLILNELVMNAVKHAFRGPQKGLLRVTLGHKDGELSLSVEDNGPGLREGFTLEGSATLGLTLITSLARQLEGSVVAENHGLGACFTLRFPLVGGA